MSLYAHPQKFYDYQFFIGYNLRNIIIYLSKIFLPMLEWFRPAEHSNNTREPLPQQGIICSRIITTRISVCMATFNGECYIKEQISSILKQLSINDEIIISDDYSTDGTLKIVESFEDDRIKIVFNKFSKGYSGNFENAITCSTGNIIFLSDQDDVWLPGKVDKMLSELKKSTFVVSNARFVDNSLHPMGSTFFSLRGGAQGFLNNLYKSRYLGSCMAFKREMFTKLLPFPKNRNLCPHDLWITLIAEFYFKVSTISEPLILYRRHENTVSSGGHISKNGLFKKVLFRSYSLMLVISRLFR
jgi:glycosyltransferase involved in cell wall biosynthesis